MLPCQDAQEWTPGDPGVGLSNLGNPIFPTYKEIHRDSLGHVYVNRESQAGAPGDRGTQSHTGLPGVHTVRPLKPPEHLPEVEGEYWQHK